MDKVRILDSRDISCSMYDDVIEVYDQNGNLINEHKLKFRIPSHMSGEDAYSFVENQGVNIQQVCYDIINEAFFENKDYDLLMEESGMTFFSPSANQFVEEPYQGVFSWLEKQLKESDKKQEEKVEPIVLPTNETTYVEVNEKQEVISPVIEEKVVPQIQNPVQPEQEQQRQEPQPYVRSNPQPVPAPYSQTPVGQASQPMYAVSTQPPLHNATPMVTQPPVLEQNSDRLKVWMMACQQLIKSNDPAAQGLKNYALSYIQSQMNYKTFSEINEKDVVFYLIENFQLSSDALTIARAALYEAYILNN